MMLEWIVSNCLVILAVLLLRAGLGRGISARLRYALWALVLVRLLVPVQLFTSPVAGLQVQYEAPQVLREENLYVLPVRSEPVDEASSVSVGEDGSVADGNSFGYARLEDGGRTVRRYAARISPIEALEWIWLAGAAALGAVLLFSNLRFTSRLRRVRRPVERGESPIPVYEAEGLPSPCLFGLLRPAVYVTPEAAADPDMLRHVLAHELTHYRHLDHLWSVLRGAALAVHWWNPLVWLAVILSRRDGELACDEGALRRLGDGERKAYGETLLALVTAKSGPRDLLSFATTMTGGERSLRERIFRIACKQKVLASATIAVILLLIVTVVCAFGRKAEEEGNTDSVGDAASSFEGMEAGAYQTSWEAEAQDEQIMNVDFRTNSTAISVQNHADVDLTVYLYHEESWPSPILQMDLPAGGRDAFRNLTSRLTYQISVRSGASGVVDLTVSDGADGSALYSAESAEDYAGYAADHPDDISSPLRDLLLGLEAEDLQETGDVSAEELARMLREAAPNRLSRFHSFARFVEEEAWSWSTAELTVSIAEGGTLYLLSCDSGNVELGYETAEGYTSAFYESDELYDVIVREGQAYFMEELPYTPDLDRDGNPDRLVLRSDRENGSAWLLQCICTSSTETWSRYANTSHAGWTSLFLCRLDGQDYLLQYTPYMGSGVLSYDYILFYLKDGEEKRVQENGILFDIMFAKDFESNHSFDPREIAGFMDEINALLANSTQLLNTDDGLLATFEEEGRLYDSLGWLDDSDFTRDRSKSLLENLIAYQNQSLAEASVPTAEEVFFELKAEDIITSGTISAEDLAVAFNTITDWTYDWNIDGWEALYPPVNVLYTREGDYGNQSMVLIAGQAGEEKLVQATLSGQATALLYSENPDNDATYLHDVPYEYTVYVAGETLYELLLSSGQD